MSEFQSCLANLATITTNTVCYRTVVAVVAVFVVVVVFVAVVPIIAVSISPI